MKCSHPMCHRSIGLVSHRRWFGKGLYCSRGCRDNYATGRSERAAPLSGDAKLFAYLFAPASAHAPALARATVRVRAHKI